MSARPTTWIGADPGGKYNFGLAILDADGSARTFCVDCADAAVEAVKNHVASPLGGVGVDAPLWWSSGCSGDRRVDQWLRETHGLSGGQVQAANSLRGAALVQGMMFVQRLREHFGDVPVTETHPKALLKAQGVSDWAAFAAKYALMWDVGQQPLHERDAVVSAVAAREGFEGRWTKDLALTRHPSEQDPAKHWLAPVHYFWP